MAYEPGTHYQYTDDNYYFLSCILEKITGMGLDRVIGERLGRPLGFRDFAIGIDPHGHHLGGSDVFIKTGAYGQGVAFSRKYPIAAAWHRNTYRVKPLPDRNDTMLLAFQQLIAEQFGG